MASEITPSRANSTVIDQARENVALLTKKSSEMAQIKQKEREKLVDERILGVEYQKIGFTRYIVPTRRTCTYKLAEDAINAILSASGQNKQYIVYAPKYKILKMDRHELLGAMKRHPELGEFKLSLHEETVGAGTYNPREVETGKIIIDWSID